MLMKYACECCGCQITKDSFDENSLPDYDQRFGSWSIAAGELLTSDNDALLIRKALKTDIVHAKAEGVTGDGSIRAVIGYLDDQHYHYAEVWPEQFIPRPPDDPFGVTRMRLVRVSAGVETILQERTWFGITVKPWLQLCYGDGLLALVVGDLEYPLADSKEFSWRTTLAGDLAGVGVGTAMAPTRFTDVQFERNGKTSVCLFCKLGCCNGPTPPHMLVVIDPYTDCPNGSGKPEPGSYLLPLDQLGGCHWQRDNSEAFSGFDYAQWPQQPITGCANFWNTAFFPDVPEGDPFPESCEEIDAMPIKADLACGNGSTVPITGTMTAVF